ncbi:P1 family peptidase [Embleya sp. NPDC005575]|uniref:P1 family peptidase n=1 Tax=Embleya sp. NPDC005575 TaxID=3156892 RepID=UPI0033B3F4AF
MTALATDRPGPRPRIRDFGHALGRWNPGAWNAITDVPDVRVGHTTLCDPEAGLYSGVTAIVPDALHTHGPLRAGLFVGNGYGKFVGATRLVELGELETPLLLTSTLSTFSAADALLTWLPERADPPPTSVNPVVGEINDTWLSRARPRPLTAAHVHAALDTASTGPVPQGNVGGGTGACALGYKAGIGTASRRVPTDTGEATVGVLVQANMSGDLRLGGQLMRPVSLGLPTAGPVGEQGSCVVVVATDLPCSTRELTRIAGRGVFALARVGAAFAHGSGDYGVALSTAPPGAVEPLPSTLLDTVFAATMDAVEEAVLDALLAAETVHAPAGHRAYALPHAAVRRALG